VNAGTFALLLSFAVLKVALGLALIYLGLRGGGRDEPDERRDEPTPDVPPTLPARRRPRLERATRGGPGRRPARRPRPVRA
jgi:hypothetical protein